MGRPDAVEAVRPSSTAEDRLRLIIDSTPALIHTARPDGYLDYFNKPWLEYVGATLDELTGWKWTAFVHPDDIEGIVARWRLPRDWRNLCRIRSKSSRAKHLVARMKSCSLIPASYK